ncbi:hypothetical protein EMN47_13330 [Prolixibacteraceae bacterium JC049]|nr:hypothetical protein [Prolixibacteraceae bacterium JC049]
MKKLFKIFAITLVAFMGIFMSCDDNDSVNDISFYQENTLDKLSWLNEMVTGFSEYDHIKIGTYNNDVVIIHGNCNPLHNSVAPVYNTKGKFIAHTSKIGDKITNQKVVWQHPNTKCHFND